MTEYKSRPRFYESGYIPPIKLSYEESMKPVIERIAQGAEDGGIPKEILAKCKETVKLLGDTCMNVSTAGSIVMYDRKAKESA